MQALTRRDLFGAGAAAGLLPFSAAGRGEEKRKLKYYYFEVNAGSQTQHFRPTHYVDITPVEARKKAACYVHASQDPPGFCDRYHEPMQRFRGLEAGVKHAEAFARHVQSRGEALP